MQMLLLIISGVTATTKTANGQTDHDDDGQLKLCKFWVAFG